MSNNDGAIAGPSWRITVANATTIENPPENEVTGQITSTITEVWNELPKLKQKCLVCFTTKDLLEPIPTQEPKVEELRRKIKNFCSHTTKDNCGEALQFCDKSIVPFCGKCFVRVEEIWLLQKQLEGVVQQIDNCVSKVWQIVQRKHSDNYISEKRNSSGVKEEQWVIDLRDMILEAYINNMTMKEELNDVKTKSAAPVPKVEIVELIDSDSENEAENRITISPAFRVKTEVRNLVEEARGNSLDVQPNDGNSPATTIVEAERGADGVVRSVESGVIGNENGSENVSADACVGGEIEIDADTSKRINIKQEKQKVVKNVIPVSKLDADVYSLDQRKNLRGLRPTYRGWQLGTGEMVVCECGFAVKKTTRYKKGVCSHHQLLLKHVAETEHKEMSKPPKKRAKSSTDNPRNDENASDSPRATEISLGSENLQNTENVSDNRMQVFGTSEADGIPSDCLSIYEQRQIGMQLRSRLLPVITLPLTPHEAVNDVVTTALISSAGESVPISE